MAVTAMAKRNGRAEGGRPLAAMRTRLTPRPAPKNVRGEITTRSRYSDQEIELGLSAVALYSGNTRRAAESLAAAGQQIPRETLRDWLNAHSTEYERVRQQITPRLKERMAERHSELAEAGMELEAELLAKTFESLGEIPARDLPGAIRNAAVTVGVHSDKARDLRGEPTAVVEHRSPQQILKALEGMGIEVEVIEDGA